MAPVDPSGGPPPAPVLGQGGFAAPAPANTSANMSAPSQASARGGHSAGASGRGGRGGTYPRPGPPTHGSHPAPAPFQPQTMHQGFPMGPILPALGLPNLNAGGNAGANDDDDDSDDEESIAISINISTPINIRGDSNLIAMDTSATASTIAQGIVKALRGLSYGEGSEQGVPLIDEEGRPRPIKVNVIAPLTVLGSKNLLGERAVMERIAPGISSRPVAVVTKVPLTELAADAAAAKTAQLEGSSLVKKRERDEGEEEEVEGDSKRTRLD